MKSGQSLKFSRWAARLSILHMLQPFGAGPWTAARWVYLHTLTFADPEPPYRVARERLNSFQNWLRERKRWAVCAPEFGKRTHRLHFHLVSVERWDAGEMWEACAAYGFGRYDVRRRPAWRKPPSSGFRGVVHEAAWYLAKYVGKRENWPEELKGMRQWSVVGAKHWPMPPCGVRDVRITEKACVVVPESPRKFSDWYQWSFLGYNLTHREKLRPDALETGPVIMREITKEQAEKVLKLVAAGDIVGVGEYRVGLYEERQMESYKGGKPTGIKVARVVVTHRIDFGALCERREFDELLPEGSTAANVTYPAKSGDLVAVAVEKIRAFTGGTNFVGRVVKL